MTADRHIRARCALMLVVALTAVPVLAYGQGVAGAEQTAQLGDASLGADLAAAVSAARDHGVSHSFLDALVQRGQEQGIADPVLLSWVRNLDGLARRQLPVDPVASRYLEGIAKGVPAARITAAVEKLEGRLEQAARHIDAKYSVPRDATGRKARLAAIDHAAYILGLGLNDHYMERSLDLVLRDSDSIQDLNAPMLTLGILVGSGLAPDKSLQVIDTAWSHGYRGSTLERLGKALGRRGEDGQPPPTDVVDQVLRMIQDDSARESVFREVDNLTGRDDYQLPGQGPGEDPTIRRGDTGGKDYREPPSNPDTRDQFKPIERST